MTAAEWLKTFWRNRSQRDKIIVSLLGFGAALLLIAMQTWMPVNFVRTLELRSSDLRFRWRGPEPPAPEVVILGIDEDSFVADTFSAAELNANPNLKLLSSWPWPRRVHALALEKLLAAGAKVVAFDLLFSTPSKSGPEDDAAWRGALGKAAGRVVIGANQTEILDPAHQTHRRKWMMPTESVQPDNIPLLDLCAAVNYEPDSDLVVRKIFPQWPTTEQNQQITAFAVRAATLFDPAMKWAFNQPTVLINYPGPAKTFPTYPYYLLFYQKGWERNLRNGGVFKDKIVLVGPTQNFLHDVHPTPFGEAIPGVEIHAAAVATILKRNDLRTTPKAVEDLLILSFAIASVLALLTIRNPLLKLLPPVALVVLYVAICQVVFTRSLLILPLAAPVVVLLPVTLMGIAWQLLTEQFERRRARAALERQVSKEVADELMKEYGALQRMLAPQEREIVAFFSDIRNFTTLSERTEPQKLIEFLNEYLSAMSAIVTEYGGTLDKFIGDGIMAFWGAPTTRGPAEDAYQAVSTALAMRARLNALRPAWVARGLPDIQIGIGINFGPALVGEVGSQQRSEYTAIGDTINTASRIEGVNKELGTDLLISEAVYQLVKDRFKARAVGQHALKGRASQVTLYHVEDRA